MNNATRIAFISEHASPLARVGGTDAGGQNVYVDELSRQLGECGYLVDIFTRRDSPAQPEIVNWTPGVRVIHLAAGSPRFFAKDRLWPFMPTFRDSLLHFMLREEIYYDLVHGHFWMSGWVATELQRLRHIPCVQLFHATGKTKQRYQQAADSSPRERIPVELAVVRQADRLIAQCPAERNELLHDYGADPEKIALIPGAVNTHTFYPVERAVARQQLGLAQDGHVIVYVGRILPRKDIRNVVRALERLINQYAPGQDDTPVTLLIVGGETEDADPRATPEIGVLQNLARELGVEKHVRFVGKRQPEVLRYYYSAGDVTVTTPWYEPFGLTPLEAMACGRPVIGSTVGGIRYTVVEGQTGLLVQPRDPEMLAARLYELLTNQERSARMGEAARLRAEQEFTWAVTARRTASLYETLIADRTTRTVVPLWSSQLTRPALLDGHSLRGSNW
ncbi:MAG TPA: glycosyltransferase [Ktedonobacteraceae bacterium]|nr:glycosyltransferase [Ktedonobacteraceae bacterium]